jgi:hypothetical protein
MIIIHNATGDESVKVVYLVSDQRVIFQDEAGLFEFADLKPGAEGWQRSGVDPTESERAILKGIIAANGGFDETTVTVSPPLPAPPADDPEGR